MEDQLKQHMNWNHYNKKSRRIKRKSTNQTLDLTESMPIPMKKTNIDEIKCDVCIKVLNRKGNVTRNMLKIHGQ